MIRVDRTRLIVALQLIRRYMCPLLLLSLFYFFFFSLETITRNDEQVRDKSALDMDPSSDFFFFFFHI